MYNDYKYYGNYDKNIKAIKGSGVITPSNPPNRTNTTGTINNKWNNNIITTPPLQKSIYYSNKILTNGYLNQNNYIDDDDKTISNYYYPSQNLNNVNNLNKLDKNYLKKKKNLYDSNHIVSPPPLITTQPNKKIKKKYISNDKFDNNSHKYIDNDDNQLNNNTLSDNLDDMELINFIKKKSLYDGKYYYTIENNKSIETKSDLNSKKNDDILLPIINNKPLIKQQTQDLLQNFYEERRDPQVSNTNDLTIKNKHNIFNEHVENFDNNKVNEHFNSKLNIILLIIFSILLIIYFSNYKKY